MKTVKQRLRELEFQKKYDEEVANLDRACLELNLSIDHSKTYESKQKRGERFKAEKIIGTLWLDDEKEFWKSLLMAISSVEADRFFVFSMDMIQNISPLEISKGDFLRFARWLMANGDDDLSIGVPHTGLIHVGRDALTEDGGRFSYSIGFSGAKLSGIYREMCRSSA